MESEVLGTRAETETRVELESTRHEPLLTDLLHSLSVPVDGYGGCGED